MKNILHRKLGFLILLGAMLRCLRLNSREIYYDDAFSFFLSSRSPGEIINGTAADTMPPLYYFLLHIWQNLGADQLWQLRLLNVGLSLLVILGIYLTVRELASEKAALWAAFFVAISPFQIYHAQELRMYVILELCLVGYFYSFIKIYHSNKSTNLWLAKLGFVIFGALAMYSHNLAIFSLVIVDIYLLLKREWKKLLQVMFVQLIIGILVIPWLLYIPQQIQKIQTAFWTPRPGLVEVIQVLIQSTASLPLSGLWMVLATVLSIQVFTLTVLEGIRQGRQNPGIQMLVVAAIAPPALMFVTSYFMRPLFISRGFIFSFLAYYALIAIVMVQSHPGILTFLLGGAMIVSAAISLPQQYYFNEFPRSPYREATSFLLENQNSLILHDNKLSYFPCHYYDQTLRQYFLADESGSHNDTYAYSSQQAMNIFPEKDLISITQGATSIQFVVFERAIKEYREAGNSHHPVLEKLEKQYHLDNIRSFNDLLIYQFSLSNGS